MSLVFKIPKAQPSLFYYKNINEVEGIITIHVDDFFSAGTAHFFKDIISKICEKFTVGKECKTAFQCLDLDLKEHTHYVKLLDTDNLKDEDIYIHDTLQSTNGKLIWISGQTRPGVGFDVCYIASNLKKSTLADIKHLKVISDLKQSNISLALQYLCEISKISYLC